MTVVTPGGGVRDRLVAAAREVLAESGVEALGVREVARRAGVSHGAPRRHFATLAALGSAVAAEGFRGLIAAVEEAVATAGPRADARARLRAAGRGYVAHARREPGAFSLMFRPERCDPADTELRAASHAAFDQLVGLVRAAQAEGWRPGAPTEALAVSVWASVHGFASLVVDGAALPVDGRVDDLLELHLAVATGDDPAAPPTDRRTP